MSSEVSTLTDQEYWNQYWEDEPHQMPDSIELNTNKYAQGLYSVFNRFLDTSRSLSVVEIGGAPGIFLTSLTRIHDDLKLGIIDYSDKGVAETKMLSDRFDTPIEVHQTDFYKSDLSPIPKYDVVYSLGVVEHYEDIELSVNRHLEVAKVGGLVIIGLPVFLGVNDWLVSRFAPENKSTWYPFIMDNKHWKKFHERSDIEVLADEYVGGFNPHVHHRLEDKDQFFNKAIYVLNHKYLAKIWDKLPGTHKVNSKYFSFFYYFVAKKLA